jgi:uncharacterized protein YqgQ
MNNNEVIIVKASGEKVPFNPRKLETSLLKSGASETVVHEILSEIQNIFSEEMTTKEIYKKAFSILKKRNNSTAARYKLKKSLLELGPSGFAFEKLVAKILEFQGYRTKVGKIVQGNCVNHEIDVVAQNPTEYVMVECKFHNEAKRICDVKVPLYIHSRFMDVEKRRTALPKKDSKIHKGLIVTNTRFTIDAVTYGKCVGLKLISWDYPKNNSLKELIDKSGLHPITSLTKLSIAEKQKLLKMGKVLSSDICKNPSLLETIGVSSRRQKNILREAHDLCDI